MASYMRVARPMAVAAIAGVFILSPAGHPVPALAARDEAAGIAATLRDQVDLAVTVYNSNIALDARRAAGRAAAGTFDLRVLDIAATREPGDGALPLAERADPPAACWSRTTSSTCWTRSGC